MINGCRAGCCITLWIKTGYCLRACTPTHKAGRCKKQILKLTYDGRYLSGDIRAPWRKRTHHQKPVPQVQTNRRTQPYVRKQLRESICFFKETNLIKVHAEVIGAGRSYQLKKITIYYYFSIRSIKILSIVFSLLLGAQYEWRCLPGDIQTLWRERTHHQKPVPQVQKNRRTQPYISK